MYPIGMSIGKNEVATAKMSGDGIVLAICLWETVFRLLAKKNGGGGARRLIATESTTGIAFHVPTRTHCVHKVRTRDCRLHVRVRRTGTGPYVLREGRWRCTGCIQIA